MGCILSDSINTIVDDEDALLVKYHDDYDFNQINVERIDYFLTACKDGDLSIVSAHCKNNNKYIYAKLYKFSTRDWKGCNGFMIACKNGRFEVAKYLYSRDNIIIHCVDIEGNNIFEYTIDPIYIKIINFLNELKKKHYTNYKRCICPQCLEKITFILKIYNLYDLECSICLNKYDSPIALNCGHIYCKRCIVRE